MKKISTQREQSPLMFTLIRINIDGGINRNNGRIFVVQFMVLLLMILIYGLTRKGHVSCQLYILKLLQTFVLFDNNLIGLALYYCSTLSPVFLWPQVLRCIVYIPGIKNNT